MSSREVVITATIRYDELQAWCMVTTAIKEPAVGCRTMFVGTIENSDDEMAVMDFACLQVADLVATWIHRLSPDEQITLL